MAPRDTVMSHGCVKATAEGTAQSSQGASALARQTPAPGEQAFAAFTTGDLAHSWYVESGIQPYCYLGDAATVLNQSEDVLTAYLKEAPIWRHKVASNVLTWEQAMELAVKYGDGAHTMTKFKQASKGAAW